jgi:integrase
MAFYDKLKKKQKITFEFLINTGARIMEVQNIKVSDVDLDRGNIVLRVTKRIVNRPGKDKKGERKIRIITISSKFKKYINKIIKQYKLSDDDYFPILSTPAANIGMKKALIKAGIKDYDMFSLHNVRKTLETWLLALNVDTLKIIKHLGHSLAIAFKHYLAPDIFSFDDKSMMREIIGDLYGERR